MLNEETIKELRKNEFPELGEKYYFATCRQGMPPVRVTRVVQDFVDGVRRRNNLPLSNSLEATAKNEAAKLLGAHPDEITFVQSTSEGLSLISQMIRWREGDNVVINDLEFVANVIPWFFLSKKGVEVRVINHQLGRITPLMIKETITPRTRLVTISSVQECNGFRCELEEIGHMCRRHRIYFVVDGIQHLGALQINVKKANIDFLVAGGHKWLLSPYGKGILYVNQDLIDELDPVLVGWRNVEVEKEDFYTAISTPDWSPIRKWKLRQETAERFASSCTDLCPGIPGLATSLAFLNEVGTDAIEARISKLVNLFIECFPKGRELKIVSPLNVSERSGIIVFQTSDDKKFAHMLADYKIICSTIYASGIGGVRVSFHFYNTPEEVELLCHKIGELSQKI